MPKMAARPKAAPTSGSAARILGFAATPAPREKRKRTRNTLLEAALRVFAAKGLDAPIADFIAEAGVSRGTFYNYFDTREDIMAAVAADLANYINKQTTPLCERAQDLLEPVAISARFFVRLSGEDRVRAAVMARMLQLIGPLTVEMRKVARARIQRAVDAGLVDLDSVSAAVDLGMGMMGVAIQHNLSRSRNRYSPELVATMILQALGCSPAISREIAHRPLPSLDQAPNPALLPRKSREKRAGTKAPRAG